MANSHGGWTSILLVGKTGNGKSSLANGLLNTSEFQVGRGMLSSTAHCKCISTHARDRDLTVVDTPGTMDVTDEEMAKTEIRRAIGFCPQGFDVFLVVVKCDARFTPEDRRAIEVVAEMFGDVFYKHAIIVFSHGDEFDNDEANSSFEAEFLNLLPSYRKKIPYLDQLLTRCGNRFVLVDNGRLCRTDVQDRQIEALLSLADGLVTSNGGKKYTSAELEAEKRRVEEAEREKAVEVEEWKRRAEEWKTRAKEVEQEKAVEVEKWKRRAKVAEQEKAVEVEEWKRRAKEAKWKRPVEAERFFLRDRELTVVDTPGTMDVKDKEMAKAGIRRAFGKSSLLKALMNISLFQVGHDMTLNKWNALGAEQKMVEEGERKMVKKERKMVKEERKMLVEAERQRAVVKERKWTEAKERKKAERRNEKRPPKVRRNERARVHRVQQPRRR